MGQENKIRIHGASNCNDYSFKDMVSYDSRKCMNDEGNFNVICFMLRVVVILRRTIELTAAI